MLAVMTYWSTTSHESLEYSCECAPFVCCRVPQVYPFSVGYLHLGSEGSAASITGGSYTASAQQGKHRSTRPSAVRISDQGHGDGGSAAGNVAGGDQPEVLAGGRGQAGGRHAGTSRAAVMSLETAALGNTTVPFEEAPALLDTLTSKLGVSLPFLVRAGILQVSPPVMCARVRCSGPLPIPRTHTRNL
jgi:hypothetical protein